jgi:tetratricopeptide (TPR) repeat protein
MSKTHFVYILLLIHLSSVCVEATDATNNSEKNISKVTEVPEKSTKNISKEAEVSEDSKKIISEPKSFPFKFNKKRLQSRKMGLTSKVTHNKLEKAYRYIRLENQNKAIEIFLELLKSTQNRPEEQGQIWQQMGFVLAQKSDYKNAIKALKKSLEVDVLPYSQTLSSIYTLAQVYMTQENYSEAHLALKSWMSLAEEIPPEPMVMMAHILAQLGDKSEALKYVNQAIVDSPQPQEKWLQLALALNHELGQYQNSLKLLIHLTALYPHNSKYWKQLSGAYLSLNDEKKALATLELAYKQGYLTEETELLNLASLYMYLDMPRKSCEILEKEMKLLRVSESAKNLEILSQAYLMSRDRERSMQSLQKAAQKSSSGDSFSKIGMLHLENEDWDQAIKAFNQSLDRGTQSPGKAFWGMAVARYQQKDLSGALKTLMKARSYKIEDKSIDSLMEQVKNEMVLLTQNAR